MPLQTLLLCRTPAWICALPLGAVVETLRPRPISPLAGTAGFVRGVATVRGRAVPVISAAGLLGEPDGPERRWVSCRDGDRGLVLAFASVDGLGQVAAGALDQLPTLLSHTPAASVAVIDGGLLLLLRATRLVPDQTWAAIAAATS